MNCFGQYSNKHSEYNFFLHFILGKFPMNHNAILQELLLTHSPEERTSLLHGLGKNIVKKRLNKWYWSICSDNIYKYGTWYYIYAGWREDDYLKRAANCNSHDPDQSCLCFKCFCTISKWRMGRQEHWKVKNDYLLKDWLTDQPTRWPNNWPTNRSINGTMYQEVHKQAGYTATLVVCGWAGAAKKS